MSFESDLRERFRRADEDIRPVSLDWERTVRRGRGLVITRYAAAAAVVVAVVGAGSLVAGAFDRSSPTPPAASPSPSPSASEAEFLIPPEGVGEGDCSAAAGARPVPAYNELPTQTQMMRANIIYAAWRCDYDELEKYTGVAHGAPFQYNIVQAGDPGGYWRELEEARGAGHEDVLARLVDFLALEPGRMTGQWDEDPEDEEVYTWPSFYGEEKVGDEEWDQVAHLFDEEALAEMKRTDHYLGTRIGITAEGEWLFFVAGD